MPTAAGPMVSTLPPRAVSAGPLGGRLATVAGRRGLAELAGGTGHSALVRLLYRNVTGVAEPTTAQIAPYVAMLDAGRYSVPEFVAQAVALDLLAVRIDLAGLALRGLELSA